MKTAIHPQYHSKVTAKCVCGATYDIGSTLEELNTEICSACHPFYTGKTKILDTAGRVDKFKQKMAAAEKAKVAKAKKSEDADELLENTEAKAEVVDEAPKAKKAKKTASKK